MGAASKIEWTDKTWSPVRAQLKPNALEIAKRRGYTSLVQILEKRGVRNKNGELRAGPHCEHASPGCANCYSETNNGRCLPSNGTGLPFDRRSRDLVDLFVDEKILTQPLRWKKPRVIFVCSQTDLYGEWVSDEMIDTVKAVEELCPQHFFLELTKHPERAEVYQRLTRQSAIPNSVHWSNRLPLPNVGLGVSVENNEYLWRVEKLVQIQAALLFVSAEPLLGELSFRWASWQPFGSEPGAVTNHLDGLRRIGWLIVGGESGSKARPCDLVHVRSLRDESREAGVPFFLKQLGACSIDGYQNVPVRSTCQDAPDGSGSVAVILKTVDRKGGDISKWPSDLKDRREFPQQILDHMNRFPQGTKLSPAGGGSV